MYRIKRRGHDSANFEMVHDEYCKLMEQGSSGDKRSKAAALRAFERLIAYKLLSYADSRYFNTFCSLICVLWRTEVWRTEVSVKQQLPQDACHSTCWYDGWCSLKNRIVPN